MIDDFRIAMEKLAFKKKVHDRAVASVEQTVKELQEEISRIQNRELVIDEGQFDLDYQSREEADYEVVNELAEQLRFELAELQRLERMDIKLPLLETVAPGAVVVTDRRTFYVSVGIEVFEVDNRAVFGLSPEAPVYEAMQGKGRDEKFSFRDMEYKIEDVF